MAAIFSSAKYGRCYLYPYHYMVQKHTNDQMIEPKLSRKNKMAEVENFHKTNAIPFRKLKEGIKKIIF